MSGGAKTGAWADDWDDRGGGRRSSQLGRRSSGAVNCGTAGR